MITLHASHPTWPHLQQLERVRRYYRRIRAVSEGTSASQDAEELLDDLYSFFQHCFHLKDWLIKDPAYTKHTKDQIEDYVNSTPELSLCADLCNASKHLILHSKPRSGVAPRVERQEATVVITDRIDFRTDGSPSTAETILGIDLNHNGQAVDLLELARRSLEAWERFILGDPTTT